MVTILKELGEVEGVIGSVIVDQDGMTVAQNLDQDADVVATAAMFFVNSVRDALKRIGADELVQALIEPADGKVFLREIEGVGTLAALSGENVNVGMIRLALVNASEKIKAKRAAL